MHTSYIEISRTALQHNIQFIRDMIGEEVTFSSVVKGNAYGHGIEEYVREALKCGVDHFSAFSADEALRVLQTVGASATIMIMGMIDDEELEWAIENDIEFFVFEEGRLKAAIKAAKRVGKPAKVHVEVETGMNRTGFALSGLRHILDLIDTNGEHVVFQGICTHFAGAESIANYLRVNNQQKRFRRVVARLKADGNLPPNVHAACSAATIRYPKSKYNMVRIGILQYGFFPSREVLVQYLNRKKRYQFPLKRVISWKSSVMDVKFVKSGEFIGYGTAFFANVDTRIAIVPVGYSYGFSRSLSNQGRVLIRGHRLPVVGTVNMSMMAIDVSELDQVERGDEVVIIGYQGDSEIAVSSFSDYSDLVNYELLTRLPQNIPRRIVE